jgi:hypothetical protein
VVLDRHLSADLDNYRSLQMLYLGRGEGKRRRGMGDIPEEGCPTLEEDRVYWRDGTKHRNR